MPNGTFDGTPKVTIPANTKAIPATVRNKFIISFCYGTIWILTLCLLGL